MKIITLHEPWASLAALNLKKNETRHWDTDYRGQLLIHAARSKMTARKMQVFWNALDLAGIDRDRFENHPLRPGNNYGNIITLVNLVDCQEMCSLPITVEGCISITAQTELERSVGLWEPERFAFCLEDNQPLPNPIPFKSRQGKLLNAPAEIVEQVNQQLAKTLVFK